MEKMKKIAEAYEGEELELIDSYIEHNPPKSNNQAVWHLGESLKKLSEADVFIGISDDWYWNGCYIEREVACKYGIKTYRVDPDIVIPNYRNLVEKTFRPVCEPVC